VIRFIEVFESAGEDYKLASWSKDMPGRAGMGLYYTKEYVDMCRGPQRAETHASFKASS